MCGPHCLPDSTPKQGSRGTNKALVANNKPVVAIASKTIEKEHRTVPSSVASSEDEQKYLHKKFKRLASTLLAPDEPGENAEASPVAHSVETSETLRGLAESFLNLSNGFNLPVQNIARAKCDNDSAVSSCVKSAPVEEPPRTTVECGQAVAVSWRGEESASESVLKVVSPVVQSDLAGDSELRDRVTECIERLSSDGEHGEGLSESSAIGALHRQQNNSSNHSGRNVCHFCNLNCIKPSVLEKHIRSHTNERPYPCVPCGFSFKTKSNLYKHCRSRAHQVRAQGLGIGPTGQGGPEDEISGGSDQELSSSASGSEEVRTGSLKI